MKSLGPIGVVLLAAGCSSRMGRCKAWLEEAGEPLLQRAVALSRALSLRPIVIVGHQNIVHERPCFPLLEATVRAQSWYAPDIVYLSGSVSPVDSLRVGLRSFPSVRGFFYWPIDTSGVDAVVLQMLMGEYNDDNVVRPIFRSRGGHPALFGKNIVPRLMSKEADQGARNLLRCHPDMVVDVAVETARLSAALNTPEHYAG